jgi:flagellar basal body-associated protein FliL
MAEKEPEPAAAEAPAGPKMIMGMTIPVLAFVLLNVLTMIGGLGYITFTSLLYKPKPILEEQVVSEISKKADKKSSADAKSGDSDLQIETFSEMTINLKGVTGGKNHFATIEPALECSNSACMSQVKDYKAKIEDLIQSKISAKSFTELGALETRFRLRHEIIQEINVFVTEGAVTNLYFTSFIVQ